MDLYRHAVLETDGIGSDFGISVMWRQVDCDTTGKRNNTLQFFSCDVSNHVQTYLLFIDRSFKAKCIVGMEKATPH